MFTPLIHLVTFQPHLLNHVRLISEYNHFYMENIVTLKFIAIFFDADIFYFKFSNVYKLKNVERIDVNWNFCIEAVRGKQAWATIFYQVKHSKLLTNLLELSIIKYNNKLIKRVIPE